MITSLPRFAHHYGQKRASGADVRAWASALIKAAREDIEGDLDQAVTDGDRDDAANTDS